MSDKIKSSYRFYISPQQRQLRHHLWIDDQILLRQWIKILRLKPGSQLVLFDGCGQERLYRIKSISPTACELELTTGMAVRHPARKLSLFWSLLKKEKNEFVLQKCTELGVTNFVPMLTERSDTQTLDHQRAEKIIIEAAEQCGRSDIPFLHEPLSLSQVLGAYKDNLHLFIADMNFDNLPISKTDEPAWGVLIGPAGGWSATELEAINAAGAQALRLSDFTLRAETAAIAACAKLMEGAG